MEIFKLWGSILINTDQANKSLAKTDKSAKNFMGVFGGYVSKVLGWFGAITSVSSAIRDVIKTGQDFDAQMSKVAAISGATGEDFDALREKAKEMGDTTKFSATESGKAFEYMAMAGWKTQDMLDGISGVMNLAAASGESLATTSDIVTDALTAFGLKASDSAHFSDVLAATASNANTDVSKMGETFKYVAPVAGSLGYSIEDTVNAIGLMASTGVKASEAGTSLRSIITRLATNAGKTKDELGALDILVEKLGVSFYNADGSARDFGDVINETREAWKKLNDQDATAFAKKIAGQYGIAGWLSLMNAAPDDINKLSEAIKNADGVAQEMADTMQDNLAGDITTFTSKLDTLKIKLSDQVTPTLRQFVQIVTNLMPVLTDLTRPIFEITARLLEELAPVIQKLLDKLLPPLVKIIEKLSPILDIVLTILDPILDLLLVLIDPIADILNMLSPLIDLLLTIIRSVLEPILPMLTDISDDLVNALGASISFVAKLIGETLLPIIQGLIDFFNGDFQSGIEKAGNGLVNAFSNALGFIDDLFGSNLKQWYDDLTKWADEVSQKLFDAFNEKQRLENQSTYDASDIRSDIVYASNAYMRQGMSAADALARAKSDVLTDADKQALFDQYLAADLTDEEAEKRRQMIAGSVPHLASGGVVYGKTLAVVGDNQNVRNDPEIVAPLSQLSGAVGFDRLESLLTQILAVLQDSSDAPAPEIVMDSQRVATIVTNRINRMRYVKGAEVVY